MTSIPTPEERDEEIIRNLEHFNATGDVTSIPFIGFDQNGKWIGMRKFSTNEKFPEVLTKKIRKLDVPLNALHKTDEDGKHFRGSYVVNTEEPVTIDFTTIRGHLIVKSKSNPYFHAPNLTDVEGKVEINSKHVDMPELDFLFDILSLPLTETLNIPKLDHVLRDLICPKVSAFNAPELLIIRGNFAIPEAISVHVPNLSRILRHFLAGNATTIFAPKLEFVRGILDTSSAPDFYSPHLTTGNWLMHPDAERNFARKAMKVPSIEI